ncbi:MAG: carbohydrate kinase family protein [Candidatus Jorgensenbacteria bacterium]
MFDVITIGTATRDIFLSGSSFKVLKDPAHLKKIGFKTGEAECLALGSKIEVEKPILTLGGGAANAAVTFARQGFKTAALIKIGDDEIGEEVVAALKREKIAPLAAVDEKLGTAYSTILLAPGGERTILVYRGASSDFREKEIPMRKLKCRWAYISPGAISIPLMQLIVMQLKKLGARVAMNPSKHYLEAGVAKLRQILRNLDVVVVNREEASYLTGIDYGKEKAIFGKFDELVPGIAVMTDGRNGASISDGKYIYRAGIFPEGKLIDRTGAGDAFGAGFVAGLMRKRDVCFALRLAAANSTSVVEEIGAEEGILRKEDFKKKRWQYLDLDVEPL